ncbi:hypothetical protein BCR35DRAFT_306323 [Leucosporidium creatinivorum]|uniref:Uncharacterized protein n=1 Tax=Leucosporidium creatinivorum TaxID=106004 RepID=A0A1Y2EUU3_9BASI|nr:hypothetical protein BCR35DRAFT_306323 [Leucosporidium creatinivorum]
MMPFMVLSVRLGRRSSCLPLRPLPHVPLRPLTTLRAPPPLPHHHPPLSYSYYRCNARCPDTHFHTSLLFQTFLFRRLSLSPSLLGTSSLTSKARAMAAPTPFYTFPFFIPSSCTRTLIWARLGHLTRKRSPNLVRCARSRQTAQSRCCTLARRF